MPTVARAARRRTKDGLPFVAVGAVFLVALVAILLVVRTQNPLLPERTVVGRATGSFDVTLVSQAPVYTADDLRYDWMYLWPFANIEYLPGTGKFVTAGFCNMAPSYWQRFGMVIITDAGQPVGRRDVCFDTSSYRSTPCGEGGGCDVGHNPIISLGGTQFVMNTAANRGPSDSPTVYRLTADGVDLVNVFYNDGNPLGLDNDGLMWLGDIAVADGKMIGIVKRCVAPPECRLYYMANAIYSLPQLGKITEFRVTSQQGFEQPAYSPIVGIGRYFIAQPYHGFSPITVYRMPTSSELAAGTLPIAVQTINKRIIQYAIDVTDQNRIALLLQEGPSRALAIYNTGPDGLILESSRPLTGTHPKLNLLSGKEIAIVGDYFAYTTCQEETQGTDSCSLHVERAGQELTVEPLPEYTEFLSLSMSDTGRILISTRQSPPTGGYRFNDLYLYQINGFTGGGPPVGTPPGYAPSTDPIDGTTYLQATSGSVIVDGNGRYAWRTGYYLKDSQWRPFIIGAGIAGTNWTNGSISASLPTDAPAAGYVIIYACKRYDTRGFVCGPRVANQTASERYWTVTEYGSASCADDCGAGATRCSGAMVQTCGNYDTDACLEWSQSQSCPSGQSCQGTACTGGGDTRPRCDTQPRTECSNTPISGGQLRNDLRCQSFVPGVTFTCYQCPVGQEPWYNTTSYTYRCVAPDDCSPSGSTRCSGAMVQTCGNYDADASLEWGPSQSCPSGQTCQGTACTSASCSDCPGWWERRCNTDPERVEVCTDSDNDGCFTWGTENTCAAGQECTEGATGAVCGTGGCASGASNAMWMAGLPGQCGETWGSCWDGSNRQVIGYESTCCDASTQCAVGASCLNQGQQWWNGAYEFICGSEGTGPSHFSCSDNHTGKVFSAGRREWCCTSERRFKTMPNTDCAGQNLKVKSFGFVGPPSSDGLLGVGICKDVDTAIPVSLHMVLRIDGQRTFEFGTIVPVSTPLCSALGADFTHSFLYSEVFTSTAPGTRFANATATFVPQYNINTNDDALLNVAITIS